MSTQRALSSLARLTPRSDSWSLRAKGNCRAKAAQRLETASWWPTVNHVYKRSNAKTLETAPAVLSQIFPQCFFFLCSLSWTSPFNNIHSIPYKAREFSNQSFSSSCWYRRCQAATHSSSCLVRFVLEAMALGESRILKKLWCIWVSVLFFVWNLAIGLSKNFTNLFGWRLFFPWKVFMYIIYTCDFSQLFFFCSRTHTHNRWEVRHRNHKSEHFVLVRLPHWPEGGAAPPKKTTLKQPLLTGLYSKYIVYVYIYSWFSCLTGLNLISWNDFWCSWVILTPRQVLRSEETDLGTFAFATPAKFKVWMHRKLGYSLSSTKGCEISIT